MTIKPVGGKIKSQDLNDNFSYLDSVVKIGGGGSPKGVYDTPQDLLNAYPNGDNSIYVVKSDGNWYYWNGTIWTPGGAYIAADFFGALTTDGEPWEV